MVKNLHSGADKIANLKRKMLTEFEMTESEIVRILSHANDFDRLTAVLMIHALTCVH